MKSLMDPQGLKAAMHTLIGVLVLHVALAELLIAQSPPTVARGRADKNQAKILKLGKPIEKDLRGGETHSYRIHAKAGQYLHVVAEQEGIHVVVTLIDPHGKQLTQTDMLNGSYGPEPLSAIVADSGYLRLEVASNREGPVAGRYKVQVTDLRRPRAEDRLRISAENTYMEGQRLWSRFDAESRKAAVGKWEESFHLWQALDDKYGQALSLHGIGRLYRALGDKEKALDSFNQALPLWRAQGDRDGEADTLNNIGCTYNGPGREQKALDYLNQALPLWRAAGDRDGEAWTLNNIGNIYSGLGDKQKALDYYNQALPLWRAAGDRDGEGWALRSIGRAGEAGTLNNIGSIYNDLGEKQKTLDYYNQVLTLSQAAGDLVAELSGLRNIARVYNSVGRKQEALDCLNQALTLSRALGGDRAAEATALHDVAGIYSDLGEKQKAVDCLNQALALSRAAGDWAAAATDFRSLGDVYNTLGEKQKALDFFKQALTLWQAVGDRPGEACELRNIGGVYSGLGEKQKALEYYNQALALSRAAGDRPGEAHALRSIGNFYLGLGDVPKALVYLNQALTHSRDANDWRSEAGELRNIGDNYNRLGEKQKALDYFNQALLLWRAVGDRASEAYELRDIGGVYSSLGDNRKAVNYLDQAVTLCHEVGDLAGEAWTHRGIGNLYSRLGEKQKALDQFNQALTLYRSAGGREGEASALNGLGKLYYDLGQEQKALDCYTQALTLYRAAQNPLGEAGALQLFMEYWKGLGNRPLAIFFGKQGIDRFQQVRKNIQGLEKEAQESFVKSGERYYRELAELLISEGRLPEAQQVLDLLKVEEYFEFTHRRGSEITGTNSVDFTLSEKQSKENGDRIADEITSLGREWSDLDAKRSRSADQETRYNQISDQLTAANQRYKEYLKGLYENFGKGDQANSSVGQIQEKARALQNLSQELGQGTVALYTLVLDQKCVVMVITPSVRVAREAQINKAALSGKVFALDGALAQHQSEESIRSKAQDLYQVLVAPIERDLQGARAKTLVWSLDDVLRYVPLAALYDGKQYLVERYQNVVITTASLGNLKDQPQVNSWHGLAMGVSKNYEGLGELKAVPGELNAVVHSEKVAGSHGPVPGTILQDDSFTQTNMMKGLGQHSPLVHIASHYVFHPGDNTKSYLLLGGKDAGGQAYHLTLASLQDEVRMDFRGVELLTLSACQTGLGSKDADGLEIDGLGITAQGKGAKAVMATLWPVDDASVGLLMETFYKLWVTTPGMTKVEALRQAQLSLLHGTAGSAKSGDGSNAGAAAPYSNPYYWAPFFLIGNWK